MSPHRRFDDTGLLQSLRPLDFVCNLPAVVCCAIALLLKVSSTRRCPAGMHAERGDFGWHNTEYLMCIPCLVCCHLGLRKHEGQGEYKQRSE